MPKVIKKRPVKKKPIEESEVKSAALLALDKIRERQKHLIIGVSVIAAIVVLFLGTSLYSTSKYKKANSIEREAFNYYYGENIDAGLADKDRLAKALELFIRSTEVKVTPTNLFYLGNTYSNLNDYEKAINEYNRFISKFISEKAILPLVYQKLASSYFRTGNNQAALETLGKLAALEGGIFKDTALMYEARHLEGTGKKEESLEKYREIFSQFPSSPWSAEANAKVSSEEAKEDGDTTATTTEGTPEHQSDAPAGQEQKMAEKPVDTNGPGKEEPSGK